MLKSVPLPGPLSTTLFVSVMPLMTVALSGLLLQTWIVVSSASTTPADPGTRLTAQLLARVSAGFVVTEHAVPCMPNCAAAAAGFPLRSLTTEFDPPLLAAAEADTLFVTTALVGTSKLPL